MVKPGSDSYKQANRKFLAKSTLQNKFCGVEKMKRILSIEGDVPDLDQSITLQKNCKNNYQLTLKRKAFHSKIFSNLAEQMHVATREAATNTDLDM